MNFEDIIIIKEWTPEIEKQITDKHGVLYADLCKGLCELINTNATPYMDVLQAVDKLCVPFGLVYGDEIGGFATGTKWILITENRHYRLGWNTWWNFFSLVEREIKDGQIVDELSRYDFVKKETK